MLEWRASIKRRGGSEEKKREKEKDDIYARWNEVERWLRA